MSSDQEWGNEEVNFDHATHEAVIVEQPAEGGAIALHGDTFDVDTSAPLSYDDALVLTEHIRSTADVLYVLIRRAHAGRAWEALNYSSFGEYVKEEFDISRSRAYQLLNQSYVIEQIEAVAPEGAQFHVSEAAARDLKTLVSDLVPEIEDGLAKLEGDIDPGDFIESMIEEARERKKDQEGTGESHDEELAADQADRDGFSNSGFGNGSGGGGGDWNNDDVYERSIDDLLGEEFTEEDSDDIFGGGDPQEVKRRIQSVYSLFSLLPTLAKMPDAADVIDWVSEDRRPQVTLHLEAAKNWINQFSQEWHDKGYHELVADNIEHSDEGTAEETQGDGESELSQFGDVEDIFASTPGEDGNFDEWEGA